MHRKCLFDMDRRKDGHGRSRKDRNMDIVSLLDLMTRNNRSTLEFGGMQINGSILYCIVFSADGNHVMVTETQHLAGRGTKVTVVFIVKLVLFTVMVIDGYLISYFIDELWLSVVLYALC